MHSDKLLKGRHLAEGNDILAKSSVYPYGNNQYPQLTTTDNLKFCP